MLADGLPLTERLSIKPWAGELTVLPQLLVGVPCSLRSTTTAGDPPALSSYELEWMDGPSRCNIGYLRRGTTFSTPGESTGPVLSEPSGRSLRPLASDPAALISWNLYAIRGNREAQGEVAAYSRPQDTRLATAPAAVCYLSSESFPQETGHLVVHVQGYSLQELIGSLKMVPLLEVIGVAAVPIPKHLPTAPSDVPPGDPN